jgi:hypothetical protein
MPPYECPNPETLCIYCNPGSQGSTNACTPEQNRCSGLQGPPVINLEGSVPWVCLSWGPNAWDASHSQAPFFTTEDGRGGGVYRYVILPTFNLDADKCAPNPYCLSGPQGPVWLCRAFATGELNTGWRMFCSEVTPANLYEPLHMILERDFLTNGPMFLAFALTGDPGCFGPTQEVYAFTEQCTEEWLMCGGDVARVVDWLEVDLDVRFSDDQDVYPTRNPFQRVLENAAWWEMSRIVDVLDGHEPGLDYDNPRKALWSMVEWFDEHNHTLTLLDLDPNPPVRGRAIDGVAPEGYYHEYRTTPIPITCTGYLSKVEVPAVLTLRNMTMFARLHPEEAHVSGTDPFEARVHATVDISLEMRVRLLPEAVDLLADAGLELLDATDLNALFDRRIADPDDAEQEHPHERLIARGPNGERVPERLSWRGVRSNRRYARVPHTNVRLGFDFEPPGGSSHPSGCAAVNAINGLVVNGQLNDTREWDPRTGVATELPQFCVGEVVFGVNEGLDAGVGCLS